MIVEIIFKSSLVPKRLNVKALYTKDRLLCIEVQQGKKILIIRYPLENIFSVCSYHQKHLGTTKN